ncbi:asparagine synthase-related protein [Saliphagus sp. LR7]|uniref:asparagine synthase-related protein n=1 Tax=Saliphagus sp. LR7 TaxID=2282654 RepID=UPI001E542F9B|nr:asparagine synthase-related protein [Saliphagus sp. LR7]
MTDHVAVATDSLDVHASESFASEASTDTYCWVVGDLYGHQFGGSMMGEAYEPRPDTTNSAQFVLELYAQHGTDALTQLNGNFLVLIDDRKTGEFIVCTDRLGTVPLYWTCVADEGVVFSTNIQTLPPHPAVETAFDPDYLHEYLAFRRTFGVKTPFEGVEKHQPGTVTTFSTRTSNASSRQYWRPRYRPREVSFDWFVDEFSHRFRTIIDEWLQDDREYGVLLSGGSDSRLVLAGLDEPTAFHMNDWMNTEARTAERAALEVGADFEFLDRGAKYRIDALSRNSGAASFNGWFTQSYTSGFRERITHRVDGLLSGLYGDSLFRGYSIPSPTISLGSFGSITLPIERPIDSVEEYIDLLLEGAHDGFSLPTDLRAVLEANIHREGDQIVHHGVIYDSIDELVYYGGCYPLSNDDDLRFHTDLRRLLPYRSPFLDDRLVDLSLSMPIRYRLRRNLIDRAIERLAPELAGIAHSSTGVALSRPFALKYAGTHVREFWRDRWPGRSLPEPYLTEGPWLDDGELLRAHPFAIETIKEERELVEALPGQTMDDVREIYARHCRGEDHVGELYGLLTALTMPVIERMLVGKESTEDTPIEEDLTVHPPRRGVISSD